MYIYICVYIYIHIQLPCGPTPPPCLVRRRSSWSHGTRQRLRDQEIKQISKSSNKYLPKLTENHSKIDQKLSKNRSKIDQNGSKFGPGGCLGRVWGPSWPQEPLRAQKDLTK